LTSGLRKIMTTLCIGHSGQGGNCLMQISRVKCDLLWKNRPWCQVMETEK